MTDRPTTPVPQSEPWAREPRLVFSALAVVYLLLYFAYPPMNRALDPAKSYSPILARGDGHYLYMGTLSLVLDRDFDLQNERARFGAPFGGRYYPLGPSLLFLPTFALAHASAYVANLFGANIPMHGYTLWHQRITFLATVAAGLFALLLGYRLACRHATRAAALWGTVAVGLGSALLFYAVYWASYAHAWTALTVTWFVYYWDRTRGRFDANRWAALGALAGLAALTRMQEVLWALLAAGELFIEAARRARARDPRGALRLAVPAAAATVCALAVASPELLANKLVFGHWLAVYTGESYMRWEAPFFWETLFATRNGLFVWTPVAYVGVLGLLLAPRGARGLAAGLVAGFFMQTWVNGSAWAWWSAWSYSNRRFLGVTIALLVGWVFAVDSLRRLHARRPRLLPHVALGALLLPWLVFNIEMSTAVSRGQQSVLKDTSSDALFLGSLTRIFRSVRAAVGSPMSWPHNWIWAARHRVSPGRYDDIVGSELLFFAHTRYGRPGSRESDAINLKGGSLARFGAGPWIPPPDESKPGAWARNGARLLVPLLVADHVRFVLTAGRPEAADVAVYVGRHRQLVRLDRPRQSVRLDFPEGTLVPGTNEVRFECDPSLRPGCLQVERLEAIYEAPRQQTR